MAIPDQTIQVSEEDSASQLNAAIEQAFIGDEQCIPVLIDALNHDNHRVRTHFVARALVSLGPAATNSLREALGGPDRQATAAAVILIRLDPSNAPDVEPELLRGLLSADTEAVGDAAAAISEIPTPSPRLILQLKDALRKHTGRTKRRLIQALSAACKSDTEVPNALAAELRCPDPVVGMFAARALAEYKNVSTSAFKELERCWLDIAVPPMARAEALYTLATSGLRSDIERIVRAALADVQGEPWSICYAARIAGEHKIIREIPSLTNLLHSSDHNVFRNASYGLSNFGSAAEPAADSLLALISKPQCSGIAAETLAHIGEAAVSKIASRISTGNAAVDRACRYALSKMSTNERYIIDLTGNQPSTWKPSPANFYPSLPTTTLTSDKVDAFESQFEIAMTTPGSLSDYTIPYPKWEFLSYVAVQKQVMLHGSRYPNLEILRASRETLDIAAYGDISGLYAEPNPVRPMYFAMVDRATIYMFSNAFFSHDDREFFYLAVDAGSLERMQLQHGTIYALADNNFRYESEGGYGIWPGEWVSRQSERPLWSMTVMPSDLPIPIWGMDERYGKWAVNLDEFPYLDDVQLYPIKNSGLPTFGE